jgi:hypothetical protein
MAQMLDGFMTDCFSSNAILGLDETINSESKKILQEAITVAESSVENKFLLMSSNTKTLTKNKFF